MGFGGVHAEPDELRARIPERAGEAVVGALAPGLPDLPRRPVIAVGLERARVGREEDTRVRALFRREEDALHELHRAVEKARRILGEAASDGAWMERMREHALRGGAPRELAREEDVRELRGAVLAHPEEAALAREIVEVDLAPRVRERGRLDDARSLESIEQEVREEEGPEMVDREHRFEALLRELALREIDAGVVREDVDRSTRREESRRERAHRVEVADVTEREGDRVASRRLADVVERFLAACRVATDEHDFRAVAREGGRHRLSDTRVRARDDAQLPLHGGER